MSAGGNHKKIPLAVCVNGCQQKCSIPYWQEIVSLTHLFDISLNHLFFCIFADDTQSYRGQPMRRKLSPQKAILLAKTDKKKSRAGNYHATHLIFLMSICVLYVKLLLTFSTQFLSTMGQLYQNGHTYVYHLKHYQKRSICAARALRVKPINFPRCWKSKTRDSRFSSALC